MCWLGSYTVNILHAKDYLIIIIDIVPFCWNLYSCTSQFIPYISLHASHLKLPFLHVISFLWYLIALPFFFLTTFMVCCFLLNCCFLKACPIFPLGFSCGSAGKESTCNAGDLGSIPRLGRSPGEGKGYPLQYSGLENSIDCIVHGVTKSQTRLSDFHFTIASLKSESDETLYSCST